MSYRTTPTKYFDPDSALISSGAGTLTNPFYTVAQITAWITSLSGVMAGLTLAIKRGSQFNGSFILQNFYGSTAAPFYITYYGDAEAMPVISGGAIASGWVQYSANTNIWTKTFASEPDIFDIANDDRIWKTDLAATAFATKLANLVSLGAGYGFYDGTTMYIWPMSGNPNDGYHEEVTGTTGTSQLIPFVAATGYGGLIVDGIHWRCQPSPALIVDLDAAGAAQSTVHVINGKMGFAGINKGTASNGNALTVRGGSNTNRLSDLLIAGNVGYGCLHNAWEVSAISGGVIEKNISTNIESVVIAELWRSCSNITSRYNKGFGVLNNAATKRQLYATEAARGFYTPGYIDGGVTRDAIQNTGNEYYYNLAAEIYSQSNLTAGIYNQGEAALAYNNTLHGDFSGSNCLYCGSSTTGTPTLDIRNNIVVLTVASGNNINTSTTGVTINTDGNLFSRGGTATFQARYLGTTYTNIGTWNALANVGTDAVAVPDLDADYRPNATYTAAINGGVAVAGYTTKDIEGNAIYGVPTVGCYQIVPPDITVSM